MGYSEVEMCSLLDYSMADFKPLNDMSGSEMSTIVEDAGLKCTSSHFPIAELRNSLDNRIEWAQEMGMKQMVCSRLQWLILATRLLINSGNIPVVLSLHT